MIEDATSLVYYGVVAKRCETPWHKADRHWYDWWDHCSCFPPPFDVVLDDATRKSVAIAVPDTMTWVEGKEIDEISHNATEADVIKRLHFDEFLKKYKVAYEKSPRWYLIGFVSCEAGRR